MYTKRLAENFFQKACMFFEIKTFEVDAYMYTGSFRFHIENEAKIEYLPPTQ
jgi:hypothetical protein